MHMPQSTTAIPYSPGSPDDPLRQFDFYAPNVPVTTSPPLLCFVHGGAWRAEDKSMHAGLAQRLVAATRCPVAVPNYRLTPPDNRDTAFHHPLHANDLLDFLLHLTHDDDKHNLPPYDKSAIVLIGHSCSAHMISCLLLKDALFDPRFNDDLACQEVLRFVKAAVLSEGIYDLDSLVSRFPDYSDWFVKPAFGPSVPPVGYAPFSALAFSPRDHTDQIHWLLLHSLKDTLVNIEQTTEMHRHLLDVHPHADHIHINTQDLTQDHDDVLSTDTYIDIINKLMSKII